MAESNNSTVIWIVVLVAVLSVGCLGIAGVSMLGGLFYVGSADDARPVVPEAPVTAVAPVPQSEPLPFCAAPGPGADGQEQIQFFARLTATAFVVEATDGTHHELSYEGTAYPYEELREQLREQRTLTPNRRDISIISEPGVPALASTRVLEIANELGYAGAVACVERAELTALERGETPVAAPDEAANPNTTEYGYGGGTGGRNSRTPRIRTGNANVRGSLSREVIRRVIRRHINEVRFCYEQELIEHPDLAGRVAVSFIISPTGAVQSASIADTSLGSPAAETCITQAVRRWTFPSPDGGGVVAVNYPFVLSSTN